MAAVALTQCDATAHTTIYHACHFSPRSICDNVTYGEGRGRREESFDSVDLENDVPVRYPPIPAGYQSGTDTLAGGIAFFGKPMTRNVMSLL